MGCGASKWSGDESTWSQEQVEKSFKAALKSQVEWSLKQMKKPGAIWNEGGEYSFSPGHGIPPEVTIHSVS